jgi:ATP-dependent DNA helicase RecQ
MVPGAKVPRLTDLDEALASFYPELDGFLPGQREALEGVLSGRDVVAVLPTGGGKTLVYQLAGLLLPGTTVVATPLIALMQDQVRRLREGEGRVSPQRVAAITGSVRGEARERLLAELGAGELDFFFSTPEQLVRDDVRAALKDVAVDLFCVDEAHCISEWGFDFRPAYRELANTAELIGRPRILALTATAPEAVQRDVAVELRLHDPLIVARGFDRPNLYFAVVRVPDPERRGRQLEKVLDEVATPAVVYCATRRDAEETAAALNEQGISAGYYHGGMERGLRDEVQDAFLTDSISVLCATSAFGMGIDKRDIRAVLHWTMPDSLEAYWQEAGRAGRDGHPSDCMLFYRPEDRWVHEHLHRRSRPSEATVARVVYVFSTLTELTPEADAIAVVTESAEVARSGASALLEDLDRFGYIERDDGRVRFTGDASEAMEAMAAHQRTQVEIEESRLDMMADYAEETSCRRRYLLNYLGDEYPAELCLRCDECLRIAEARGIEGWDLESQEERIAEQRQGAFDVGEAVVHPEWGRGVVQRVDGDVLVVRFDDVGYRTLHGPTVVERGLLDPAP